MNTIRFSWGAARQQQQRTRLSCGSCAPAIQQHHPPDPLRPPTPAPNCSLGKLQAMGRERGKHRFTEDGESILKKRRQHNDRRIQTEKTLLLTHCLRYLDNEANLIRCAAAQPCTHPPIRGTTSAEQQQRGRIRHVCRSHLVQSQ